MIEILEARIAPAALTFLNNKTATYKDVDGDLVTITITKGDIHIADYLLMDTGAVGGAQLTHFDISQDKAHFTGTNVTISAQRQNGQGDARVNVGDIDSTGTDLGIVTVHGDLGRIVAGSNSAAPAVAALNVGSIGFFGTSTGAPDLNTAFTGKLGVLKVTSDVIGADINSTGLHGGFGSVTIGGSLMAGPTGLKGRILATTGDIGLVKIGGDLRAGTGDESGKILSLGKIAGLTIGGSVYGGSDMSNDSTQQIASVGNLGPVKIGGSIFGGTAPQAGGIQSLNGAIASVTIGGDFTAGSGAASGHIIAATTLGPVKIGGNFTAGITSETGKISAATITSIYIGGSIYGSSGNYNISGEISSQIHATKTIGAVTVIGSLIGGPGTGSAKIYGEQGVASVTVGGSLISGGGAESASIGGFKLGTVKIGGDLQGTASNHSGGIEGTLVGSITVAGSVLGSQIFGGTIASVVIAGSLAGTDATHLARIIGSGVFNSALALTSVKVLGDVKFAVIGAGYTNAFTVASTDRQIGSITVGGDWLASTAAAGVDPKAGGFADGDDVKIVSPDNAAIVSKIGSISIGGQISGTTGNGDHYGFVAQQIGSFKIDGQLIPLTAGTHNDLIQLGLTGDVTIREIAL